MAWHGLQWAWGRLVRGRGAAQSVPFCSLLIMSSRGGEHEWHMCLVTPEIERRAGGTCRWDSGWPCRGKGSTQVVDDASARFDETAPSLSQASLGPESWRSNAVQRDGHAKSVDVKWCGRCLNGQFHEAATQGEESSSPCVALRGALSLALVLCHW